MGRLERRRREENAVIRDNANGEAVDVCEPLPVSAGAISITYTRGEKGEVGKRPSFLVKSSTNRHNGLSVFLLELAKPASIHHTGNHFSHVKWLTKVRTDDSMQLGRRIEWVFWNSRWLDSFEVNISY
jgi:hypothetical protein